MAIKKRTRKLESSIVNRRNAAVRAAQTRAARAAANLAAARADLAASYCPNSPTGHLWTTDAAGETVCALCSTKAGR